MTIKTLCTVFRNKRQLPKETGMLCHFRSFAQPVFKNLKLPAKNYPGTWKRSNCVQNPLFESPSFKLQITDEILLPLINTKNDFDVTKQHSATIWVFFQYTFFNITYRKQTRQWMHLVVNQQIKIDIFLFSNCSCQEHLFIIKYYMYTCMYL